ncbi:hypothetical protein L1987_33359 [Smallanthus sonchifolius]|uniref:Uncharacterized protein n=1 Tax=Smallanthus sonchifolius TaxID=185202 RepID=A0ACB9HQV1_9ASTR|nr:hypothetical protein L1987_33359 [Smallanthus sonchifolius]
MMVARYEVFFHFRYGSVVADFEGFPGLESGDEDGEVPEAKQSGGGSRWLFHRLCGNSTTEPVTKSGKLRDRRPCRLCDGDDASDTKSEHLSVACVDTLINLLQAAVNQPCYNYQQHFHSNLSSMATSSFISSGFPQPSFQISISKQKKASMKILAVMTPQTSKPSTTGSVKTGMTMTEKIFARASERTQLSPGENVWVNVDILMTHDGLGPGAIGVFKKEFGDSAKDRERVVLIPGHYIFTSDERANRNVGILWDFANEQTIKYFYDITDRSNFKANPDYKGVCHIALAQEGHCRPGEILVGTDSHTCTAGAFGQFATGIGSTDAGFVLGTGKLLLKDLILQIIGEISVAGATYKAMEFVGTTVESLSMEERMTICNMVVEAGGKNGIVPADATTFAYLEDKNFSVI